MKISKKLLLVTFFILYILHVVSEETERKVAANALLFVKYIVIADTLWHTEWSGQSYIVYMGELTDEPIHLAAAHHSLLSEIIGDETIARKAKIHSYGRSFNGFAARLLPHEAKLLSQKKGVVSVFPNKSLKLLTTRSWDFIGMPEKVARNLGIESDIIVATIDTGVWPDSPSFNDKGFGPPPSKWKGKCDKGVNFTSCNNKLIGAQYFDVESMMPINETTPVDTEGHGTHTASTAAGINVKGASLYGIANGTARGGVPSARIASYKACWEFGCVDANVLAAFDVAIADNVDIISVSLGGSPRPFYEDSIAIGSFHALKKGIMTVCAAGNDGPNLETVGNHVPWIFTVAATSIDRQFQTDIELGNGDRIPGIAINTYSLKNRLYPLTDGAHAQNFSSYDYGNASNCDWGKLSTTKVKGRIVHCLGMRGDSYIKSIGGSGAILTNNDETDTPFPVVLPGTFITSRDGNKIRNYINTTGSSAKAFIYKTKTVSISNAPTIATFSSRGPQTASPQILKPDISAPGVAILAAYTKYTTMTGYEGDDRVVKYNIVSGTSMACPHVSGAAAYVKSFHPDWSPAAIKSALMTTSKSMKVRPAGAELASGSGNIHPKRALNPGLIYEIDTESYISYLCKQNFSMSNIGMLVPGNQTRNCSDFPIQKGVDGLNYPSMHLQLQNHNETDISGEFYRTLTNVGSGEAVYKVRIRAPKSLSITVVPDTLTFVNKGEKKSFKVSLKGKFLREKAWVLSGGIVWYDSKKHHVKSPILVYRPQAYRL